MPITIIVEDGSNVANANSYVSVATAREYAEYRGIELDADDETVAAQIIVGMDYLEAKECDFQGERTYEDQALSWPRKCVYINCKEFAEDAIPNQLKGALVQLVMAQEEGIDIAPNSSPDDFITSAKVGPLSVTYADPLKISGSDLSPNLTAVNALLAPLFGTCEKQAYSLRTVRV
jgi:hypothetical protein